MVGDTRDESWTPVDGVEPPAEQLELDDLALVAEVSHSVRSRVMRRLKNPRSVAEVADDLGVPVTRLYHHVNRLTELGLIRVVATRKVGAVTERRYQVAAKSLRVAPPLLESGDRTAVAAALGSVFDIAKHDLQREVESGRFTSPDLDSVLSLGELVLSSDRRRELLERLTELIADFESDTDDHDPDATRLTLFVSAFDRSD